jgi:predicted PurR-regulated permease PerM
MRSFRVLSATFLILIILGASSYILFWQYDQINQLNKQIDNLNSQLLELTKISSAQTDYTYVSEKSVSTKVFLPVNSAKVSSPLTVIGQVPGNWSFEASFPVKLKNSTGSVVAEGIAQIIGDWMTTELVPFSIELTWDSMESGDGTLVLQKDNPSGMSENEDSVSIPIKF